MPLSLRFRATLVLAALLASSTVHAQQPLDVRYRADATRLIQAALADSFAYNRLATMVDRFGHRLSGSDALERTIDWAMDEMRRDGLQNVHGEPIMVPHWVRGEESAELVSPRALPLHMIGLGMSVGTPPRRAARSCSSTCPSPPTARRWRIAAAARARRRRWARWAR